MNYLNRHRIFLYQNYLVYGIAFFIPLFPKAVPLLIVLFGLLSLISIARGLHRVELSEVSILMIIYFILHVVGMAFTENQSRGWFNVEVKLSLIALPIAFMGYRFLNAGTFTRTLQMFLYGTLISAGICFLHSLYKVGVQDLPYYHFVTSRFSFIIHQSYFALYLIFSLVILIYLEWPVVHRSNRITWRNLLLVVFLSVAVILTGSKTGFIMWVMIALGLTVMLVREMQMKWLPILGLAAMMSIMGAIFQSAPLLQSRIVNVLKVAQSEEVNPASTESTAMRYLVYSSAFDIIQTQPWYGQGTGDFQDVLDQVYHEKGYTGAAEKHLNAHNLFLQSWISIGIPGLIVVIGIFLVMATQAWRNRDGLLLAFTALFVILSMTESTFNVQTGVVFFSFFAVLLARRSGLTVTDH